MTHLWPLHKELLKLLMLWQIMTNRLFLDQPEPWRIRTKLSKRHLPQATGVDTGQLYTSCVSAFYVLHSHSNHSHPCKYHRQTQNQSVQGRAPAEDAEEEEVEEVVGEDDAAVDDLIDTQR